MIFSIGDNDPRPVYLQIASAVKEGIRTGRLKPGDTLPSVRELGQALSVNLHTARHAYQLLAQEGVIQLRLGRLAKVAPLERSAAIKKEMCERISGQLKELVSDALISGISPEQFKEIVEEALEGGFKNRRRLTQ